MKVFLIGGNALSDENLEYDSHRVQVQECAANVGQSLCHDGNDLVVCSPFPGSADVSAVIRAAEILKERKTGSTIEFHHPDCPSVENEIRELIARQSLENVRLFAHSATLDGSGEKPTNYDWLLAQLLAMESSQAVIAVGGKSDRSASMLLRLAESVRKPVIPFTFLGGAADQSYQRRQYQLQDMLGPDVGLLREPGKESEVLSYLPRIASNEFTGGGRRSQTTFFISYPRERPEEADFVEMVLRRRGLIVYRDERDFGTGNVLQHEIDEYIHRSSVFVALWCKEYACSPWCFDELELALSLQKSKGLKIWLFSLDGTRIVPRNARGLISLPAKSRSEVERNILALLDKG